MWCVWCMRAWFMLIRESLKYNDDLTRCVCVRWKKRVFSNCCYVIATFYFSSERVSENEQVMYVISREKKHPCRCNFTGVTAFFSHFLALFLIHRDMQVAFFCIRHDTLLLWLIFQSFCFFSSCLFGFCFVMCLLCTSNFLLFSSIITFVWWK